MSTLPLVRVEDRAPGVRSIVLAGPKGNALSPDLVAAFAAAVETLSGEDDSVVLVESAHPKAFMVGGDLEVLEQWIDAGTIAGEWSRLAADMAHALTALRELDAFVIAVVDGPAVGGGLELMLTCDYRIAARGVRVGFPEIQLGVYPAAGSVPLLAKHVHRGVAIRLLLTGDLIDSDEAFRLGLIDELVDPGGALAAGLRLAERLALAPRAVARVIDSEISGDWAVGLVAARMYELLEGIEREELRAKVAHRAARRRQVALPSASDQPFPTGDDEGK